MITYDDFAKLDIRIGKIIAANRIPDTEKLLLLKVDLGEEHPRIIVSGIAKFFPDPAELIGTRCPFVANLQPRVIRGHESNGMILAIATENNEFALLLPHAPVPVGSKIC